MDPLSRYDPIRFNFLLAMWDEVARSIIYKVEPDTFKIVKLEEDIKRQVRQQVLIDKLKKSFGCS